MIARRTLRTAAFVLIGVAMLAPLYLLVTNAFKTQQDIVGSPFGWPDDGFTLDNLWRAATSTDFNVVGAYGTTALLVIVERDRCGSGRGRPVPAPGRPGAGAAPTPCARLRPGAR